MLHVSFIDSFRQRSWGYIGVTPTNLCETVRFRSRHAWAPQVRKHLRIECCSYRSLPAAELKHAVAVVTKIPRKQIFYLLTATLGRAHAHIVPNVRYFPRKHHFTKIRTFTTAAPVLHCKRTNAEGQLVVRRISVSLSSRKIGELAHARVEECLGVAAYALLGRYLAARRSNAIKA